MVRRAVLVGAVGAFASHACFPSFDDGPTASSSAAASDGSSAVAASVGSTGAGGVGGGGSNCPPPTEWAVEVAPLRDDTQSFPVGLQSLLVVDHYVLGAGFTDVGIGSVVSPSSFYLFVLDADSTSPEVIPLDTGGVFPPDEATISLARLDEGGEPHLLAAIGTSDSVLVDDYPMAKVLAGIPQRERRLRCTSTASYAIRPGRVASNGQVAIFAAQVDSNIAPVNCTQRTPCNLTGVNTTVAFSIAGSGEVGCPTPDAYLDKQGDQYRTAPRIAVGDGEGTQVPLLLTVLGGGDTAIEHHAIEGRFDTLSNAFSWSTDVELGQWSIANGYFTRAIPAARGHDAFVAASLLPARGSAPELSLCVAPNAPCLPLVSTGDTSVLTALDVMPSGPLLGGNAGPQGLELAGQSIHCDGSASETCPFWLSPSTTPPSSMLVDFAHGGTKADLTVAASYCNTVIWGGTFAGQPGDTLSIGDRTVLIPDGGPHRVGFLARQKIQ